MPQLGCVAQNAYGMSPCTAAVSNCLHRPYVPQVHPAKLTHALVSAAEAKGARVLTGTVQGVQLADDGQRVQGAADCGAAVASVPLKSQLDL